MELMRMLLRMRVDVGAGNGRGVNFPVYSAKQIPGDRLFGGNITVDCDVDRTGWLFQLCHR